MARSRRDDVASSCSSSLESVEKPLSSATVRSASMRAVASRLERGTEGRMGALGLDTGSGIEAAEGDRKENGCQGDGVRRGMRVSQWPAS